MADVFPYYCLFFSILTMFRRKIWVKVGPKVLTLDPCPFHKYSNHLKIFQAMFLFTRVLALVRAQKPPKNGYLVDTESVLKTLETFNLTSTNAILVKLTKIMHLHESLNRKALRIRNSFFGLI